VAARTILRVARYTGLEPLFGSKIVQSACCWPPARNLDPMKSWRR
jgi:hypothetical protein